jgi:autotransporter-associated beta strand protein
MLRRGWPGAWIPFVVGLVLAVGPATARAIGITGYTSAANDRFSGGFSAAPVANTNPAFVGLGYDWSGVGWSTADPTKGFGFITPRHYLVARHYGGATTIRLEGAGGTQITGTQAAVTATGYGYVFSGTTGDLSIGRLVAPLPASASIARYGVLDLNASSTVNSVYNGQPLLVYGRGPNGASSPRIGAATVNGTGLSGAESAVSTSYADVQLQSGDSGSPIFVPWTNANGGRELTILGNNAGTDFSTVNVYNYLANSTVMGVINGITTADGFALRVVGNPAQAWQGGSGSPAQQTHLSRGANWSGASVPTDRYVRFDGDDTSFRSITVNAATNLRGLAFTSTNSGTLGFTFSGTNTLTVGRGGIVNYDTARQTFTAPLSLGAPQYWDVGPGGVTIADVATNGSLLEIAGSGTARIAGTVSGSGGLALSGHRLELAGSSTHTGTTWVHAGTLALSGTLAATPGVVLGTTGTLAGTGRITTGPISGAGLVSPGASPGILTAPSVDPSGGLDFAFEFTTFGAPTWGDALASGNDVLRLTGSTPFLGTLTASNTIDVLLGFSSPLFAGALFQGGFFTDADADFMAALDNATFAYWLADPGGVFTFNGITYSPYAGPLTFTRSTVPLTAAFAGGSEPGFVLQFVAVPEPATMALLLAAVPLVVSTARRARWTRTLAVLVAGLLPPLTAAAAPEADERAAKWEPALAAFEAQDRETPPAPGGIVFLGSSSIRRWDVERSFPDLPVVNRGFGGSEIPDCTRVVSRIVVPHAPRVVVVYAGDNDIARGRSAAAVADDFGGLVAALGDGCPDAMIVFLAIKPSPARRQFVEPQREANRLIRAMCAGRRDVVFVDVVAPMLGADGEPRAELFVADGLHLDAPGYALWTRLVMPHLRQARADPAASGAAASGSRHSP